jgi:hypothetical protein
VNLALIGDRVLDAARFEIVIYGSSTDRKLRLMSSVRSAQSIRSAGVLYAARLGVEGQPERRVRELASEGVV